MLDSIASTNPTSFLGSVSREQIENHPMFVDRFFTRCIYPKKGPKDDHVQNHSVLIHSNGICIIGIAPTHPAMHKKIDSVSFNIGNFDRSQNEVSGKSKKGGMILQENSSLCRITCADGSEYIVISCMQGKLVEVNKKLITNPELILQGDGAGYVAILLPKAETIRNFKAKFGTNDIHALPNSEQQE